jgi:hypothetical protein
VAAFYAIRARGCVAQLTRGKAFYGYGAVKPIKTQIPERPHIFAALTDQPQIFRHNQSEMSRDAGLIHYFQCCARSGYVSNNTFTFIAAKFDLGRLHDAVTRGCTSFDHALSSLTHVQAGRCPVAASTVFAISVSAIRDANSAIE